MPGVRAAVPFALLVLLAGCTPATAPSGTSPSATATAAPETPIATLSALPETAGPTPSSSAEVDPTPVKCALSEKQVRGLVGIWDRAVNAIGRGDQATYTGQLVTRLGKLAPDAAKCPGADTFDTVTALGERIHASAKAGDADLDAVHEFAKVGNEWLGELGYRPLLLS